MCCSVYYEDSIAWSNHIKCVRFDCSLCDVDTVLGDDWCQLLADGPMSRPVCHLDLRLSPAQCGVLLSRVCDAERLEEFSLKVWGSNTAADLESDIGEDVKSNVKFSILQVNLGDSPDWCHLWSAVVKGMANTNNNVDFILKAGYHSGGHIISQLPPQCMKKFEVVEKFGTTYFISKPHVHETSKERSMPSGESVSKTESSTVPGPSLVSILTRKRSPQTSLALPEDKVKCSEKNEDSEVFQEKSDNEDAIKSPSDLLPYNDKMIAHLTLLGAVLGVGDYTSAIMKEPGDPPSRCINILSHWIEVTPHPTWTIFCDRLKRAKEFNNLRSKICREHGIAGVN